MRSWLKAYAATYFIQFFLENLQKIEFLTEKTFWHDKNEKKKSKNPPYAINSAKTNVKRSGFSHNKRKKLLIQPQQAQKARHNKRKKVSHNKRKKYVQQQHMQKGPHSAPKKRRKLRIQPQ